MTLNNEEEKYLTVKELNDYIKVLFDNTTTLKNIYVKGEISNYNGRNISGHYYFSIKDEFSSIKCVFFKYDALKQDINFKNGDEVIILGSVSSYPPSGSYQIIIKEVVLYGEGQILLKKQKLLEKYEKLGYFDKFNKKELPKYPKKIAVITGLNSAAQKDIDFNIKRRYPFVEINYFNSLVQGEKSLQDVIEKIDEAEKSAPDLIILARGGGSVEDLQVFDEEQLVERIHLLKVPLISAIGHEINQSLCDMVADKYASTPTGAAEIAVPDINEILENLLQTKTYLDSIINNKINDKVNLINRYKENPIIINFNNLLDIYLQKIAMISKQLDSDISKFIDRKSYEILNKKQLIENLNPEKIMENGYSIAFKGENVVDSIDKVNVNDDLTIKVKDGYIKVKVLEKGE